MRPGRPSLTASLVAGVRALYSEFPKPLQTARDPLAQGLVGVPLSIPARLAALTPSVAPWMHRTLGLASFGLSYHVALRTRAIDDAVARAVAHGAKQLVVLGAGLDARAERLELGAVRLFEVDEPAMIEHKRARLASISAAAYNRVRFVAVDFEHSPLDAALTEAGFCPPEPAVWIWEGVTMYLSRQAIARTLGSVARCSAPGSQLAMTYVVPDRVDVVGRTLARVIREPIRGAMSSEEMHAELSRFDFAVVSDESATIWAVRYWGEMPRGIREWERLVIASAGTPPTGSGR